jgi:predicted RNase H-like HicB family nuclease
LFAKTLPAHTALAGVVTTGDSLEVAVEKLDGNVLANDADITAIQGVNTTQSTNISTLTSTLGAPTSANTANQIVKRDGSGNFAAGTITATSFVGAVTGNVTGDLTGNVTGNVTGNTSGSAATFTGSLAGDVTGTQAATVLAPSVLYGKTLQASFVPVTGAVSIGDSLEVALEKTTGNIADTVNKTSTNANAITALDVTVSNLTTRVTTAENDINLVETAIGTPTALNTPNQIVKRDGSGNFAAGTVTATSFVGDGSGITNISATNITGTVANATSAVNFSGSLAGDVTGTQGATVLGAPALYTKQLQASYLKAVGVSTVAIGDSLEVAIEKLDGNIGAAVATNDLQNTDIGNLSAAITTLQNYLTSVSNVTLIATSFSALDESTVVLTADGFNLNTINNGIDGQKLTIVFTDACLVGETGNINLSVASISADVGDVLELVFTGSSWKQISYSNN